MSRIVTQKMREERMYEAPVRTIDATRIALSDVDAARNKLQASKRAKPNPTTEALEAVGKAMESMAAAVRDMRADITRLEEVKREMTSMMDTSITIERKRLQSERDLDHQARLAGIQNRRWTALKSALGPDVAGRLLSGDEVVRKAMQLAPGEELK